VLEGRWRGGNTLHRPGLSPLFFAYKNRGEKDEKKKRPREHKRKETETREQRKSGRPKEKKN
jgi:hypothetical protein